MKNRQESLVAGVDIGGTNIRIALADALQPTEIVVRDSVETQALEGPDQTVELLANRLEFCLRRIDAAGDQLLSLGCTVPGVTDAATGTALFVSNLRGWDGYPVSNRLSEALGVPVVVENDVNAAAFGEYEYGSGVGCHSIVYLTVSTGVAAGIVVEGQLLRGFHHGAGELGFFVPDPHHLDKDWSPNGCLELKSAGIGLAQMWAEKRGISVTEVTAIDVFDAADKGEAEAVAIVKQASDYLAQAAIAISSIIDPERLVLGGSIAQHQPIIVQRMRNVLQTMVPHYPEILLSNFEGDAPLVGALALAKKAAYRNYKT